MTIESIMDTEELSRYQRQLNLNEIGENGQRKLKHARVLCIGAGGLGSPLLLYLAAAGVGTIGIIDHDIVELSNLQRQIIYSETDIKQKKVAAAKAHLQKLNSHITIIDHPTNLNESNALNIINQYDIIADGSDNFATKYLVNDACCHLNKPNVFASVLQFQGQCSIFSTSKGPCYRCLFPSPPSINTPNCTQAGVLGVVPGIIGSIQATEVIKLILNIGEPLIGKLLTFNALDMSWQKITLPVDPHCKICALQTPFEQLPRYQINCELPDNRMTVAELTTLLQQHEQHDLLLLDVRQPHEYANYNINGTLIPLTELPQQLNTLDRNKKIIVHCKSGPRSIAAVNLLLAHGFTDVSYLQGGLQAWVQAKAN